MKKNEKKGYIANFNCTFGEEETPMLEHLFDIILPALEAEQDIKNDYFILENVKLSIAKGDYVLAGLIVKRTSLEIKSRYENGKLVNKDETYTSDPYSYFIINLKNHRLALVKNQKGSPTIANFATIAREKINSYINEFNNKTNEEEEKLPQVKLNVVNIPFENAIKLRLDKVEKIKNVTLRFYPRNGDILDDEIVEELYTTLKGIDGKTGSISFNSPKDKNAVAKLIENTKGLMKPTIKVEFPDGTTSTLKDDSFTEEIPISHEESQSFNKNIDDLTGKFINKDEFNKSSDENIGIYNKWYTKIENFFKKQ